MPQRNMLITVYRRFYLRILDPIGYLMSQSLRWCHARDDETRKDLAFIFKADRWYTANNVPCFKWISHGVCGTYTRNDKPEIFYLILNRHNDRYLSRKKRKISRWDTRKQIFRVWEKTWYHLYVYMCVC